MILLGIDPGVTTGWAAWSIDRQTLAEVGSGGILQAMVVVKTYQSMLAPIRIILEDARLRTWFGEKGREALQGAGSIKRDCSIWCEFAELHGIALKSVKPAKGATKWDAETFKRVTGWKERTNEHARDAAMLVYGLKNPL